jgi:hypothetical protein
VTEERWHSLGKNTSKKFKVGNLVSWKLLGEDNNKDFGIIVEIFETHKGGRNIVLAKMVRFKDNSTVSIPIINLKKVSKDKMNEI